jgi:hypothetical protein
VKYVSDDSLVSDEDAESWVDAVWLGSDSGSIVHEVINNKISRSNVFFVIV